MPDSTLAANASSGCRNQNRICVDKIEYKTTLCTRKEEPMGYYMEQLGHDFRISSANTAAAFGALKEWERQEIARHPAYRQLGREPLNGADTLEDALAELG